MRLVFFLLFCCSLVFTHASKAMAGQEVILDAIDFASQGSGAGTVMFSLTGKSSPKIFMLTGDKPRLVVDFVETRYSGPPKVEVTGNDLVDGIRIGVHHKPQMKTRVVIDLAKGRKLSWNRRSSESGNMLRVDLVPEEVHGTENVKPVVAVPRKDPEKDKVVQKDATSPEPKAEKIVVPEKHKQESKTVADTVEVEKGDVKQRGSATVQSKPKTPPAKTTALNNITAKADPEKPFLLDVTFDGTSQKGEMIMFKLDDFHPPVVSAIEKGIPRIVCDFYNMRIAGKIRSSMDVDGQYVDKIRVARHENPGKVRAVLDLVPGNDYDLQQVFFNEDNLFVLIVNILDDEKGKSTVQ